MTYKFVGQMNCDKCKYDCSSTEHCPYTAGWQDGQEKLTKWLMEPCKEHELYLFHGKQQYRYEHRYLCPSCMAELRGEK